MAENTIDNLSIQVVASAERAISTFNRLASGASGLRGAVRGATGGMQDMAHGARDAGTATQEAGTQSGKARPNIKGVGKDAKDAGENAKKGSSGLATFWQSLKRIAYYRMIRSIIKSIGQAFKEGAQNLYQWSKGTGLSDFSKNLDRIATSALYLKNSLGAMLEPIIRVLTPIIETVVDGLVWIINHVNMLFAALSGSQTYTVAKKVATTWGDAADDVASSTHKAAEDIRRTLLGFDEINRLDKPTNGFGSGGYGGNNNNNNFNDMFETRQLDGWMAALAKFINDFNLQIPATIATIVAGFETIKLAIKAVSDLSLGWLKDMAGKTIEVAVSLVRSGWETIKGWAVSFGEAVVDLAVRVKTKIADLWASIVTAWNALNPVLQVGIVIGVTAAALWAAYQLAWALAPEKMLEVEATIKTTASALWGTLQTAWGDPKTHVLSVAVSIITTCVSLWKSLQTAWGNAQNYVLNVAVSIVTSAAALWKSLQSAWGKATSYILGVAVSVATSAKTLFDSIQNAWKKLADASLPIAVYIATAASTLKKNIADAWGKLGDWALGVSLGLATSAAQLQSSIQSGWNKLASWALNINLGIITTAAQLKNGIVDAWAALGTWFLGVKLALATTAEGLKLSIVDAWAKLSAWYLSVKMAAATTAEGLKSSIVNAWSKLSAWYLSVKLAVATTAEGLKSSIVDAWGKLTAWFLGVKLAVATTAEGLKSSIVEAWSKLSVWYLSVKLAVATTAEGLKSSIVESWGKLTSWFLGVKLAIATTAEGLKNSIVDAWWKLPAWFLSVKLAIATTAEGLKTSIVTAWNKLTAWSLDVAISSADKIKTAVNNVWGWVKDNWEIVAAGALGIAIAIATPWSTIAAALSGLWADVMASFGGALAFSIVPTLGSIFGGGKGKAAQLNPNASYYDNSTGELVIKTSPTEVQVDATPGRGFKENNLSRKQAFELDGIEDASVNVGLQQNWLGTPEAELGVDNLQGTVTMSLGKEKDWANNGWKKTLGLKDKTAKITAKLNPNWNTNDPLKALNLKGLTAVIKTKLQKEQNNTVSYKINAGGGTGKGVVAYELKRRGGVFSNGRWSDIPQYANGTLNAGTIFAAGEAGPEVVGHVGGRTEVLNKSQLASAMFSAVQAAMAPAAANFASAAQSMGVADAGVDMETLAEMVRQGVEQAMGRQNELDRQRNEYLRQINEKDYNPEISTSSINKAQQRMNRRAGTTIVPVGT